MTQQGAPSPFSREGSHPQDGLGADFRGFDAPIPPPPTPPPPTSAPMGFPPSPALGAPPFDAGAYAQADPGAYAQVGWPSPAAGLVPQHAPAPGSPFPVYPSTPGPPGHYPGGPMFPYAWGPTRKASPYGVASLVAGILAIFMFITGPVAIGLGIAGLRQVQAEPDTYEGTAQSVAGIVTGGFGTLILGLIIAAMAGVG